MSRRMSLSEAAMRLLNLALFSPKGLQAAKMRTSAPIPEKEKEKVFGTAPSYLRRPLLAGNRGKLTRKKRKEIREREENRRLAVVSREIYSKAERRHRDGHGSMPRSWRFRNADISINGVKLGTGDGEVSY